MTTAAITNARVLTPRGFLDRHAVLVDQGRIVEIVPTDAVARTMPSTDLGGLSLIPGFIDTQVNGGGGILFNDDPSVDAIVAIGAAHRRFGTTAFLPTLISDDLEVIKQGIDAVDQALREGVPGVIGIHIEGPFLNPARKGIHDEQKLRALDEEGFAIVTRLKRGRTLITLAPEMTGPGLIAKLTRTGMIVAAGHTNATYRQIRDALDQGLRGFTHLFNAMSPLTTREPGTVGAALEDSESWCGLIVDGRHVDPVTMRLALRCKSPDRMMLVTDGMPSVGTNATSFRLQGHIVEIADGVCINPDGTLAGTNLDMASAVNNAVSMLGIDLREAIGMASSSPARFLGLDHLMGAIATGLAANLVALDAEGRVVETWIDGASIAG